MNNKKIISVGVPPGLGDIHWVLTKLESFKKKNSIDFLKVVVYEDSHHNNSADFLRMIPFIDEVKSVDKELPFDFVKPDYRRKHFKQNCGNVDYLIEFNTPLEMGNRIERVLPEYAIDFNYSINLDSASDKYAKKLKERIGGKLVLMYSSSNAMNNAWTGGKWSQSDWVRVANLIKENTGCQVVLIGKQWDKDNSEGIKQFDINNSLYDLVGETTINQALALINNACAFVGFPSGLTILSTKFNTPVVMFWSIKNVTPNGVFNSFFQTCWVDKRVLSAGTYLSFMFGDASTTPKKVFQAIERFLV